MFPGTMVSMDLEPAGPLNFFQKSEKKSMSFLGFMRVC